MAYGEKYCKLAIHLYMTYKLFGNCKYPFYVITNEASAAKLKSIFDGVIVKDNFVKSTSDKLMFFTDNPFEESVFIDSDCSIVSDVNYIFDEFSKNGYPVSAIANCKNLLSSDKGHQFGINVIQEFGIKKDFPDFNGGVYYYKRCKESDECISFMFDTVMKNYNHFGLRVRDNGTFADEPVVIVSMLKFGFYPLPLNRNIMYLVHNKTKVKWDMNKCTCKYKWYEHIVSPTIIHWTIGGTETFQFEKYDCEIQKRFFGFSSFWLFKHLVLTNIKYHLYPHLLKVFPFLHKIVTSLKK